MQQLWKAITDFENAIAEQQKRDLLAAIISIMAGIGGFPIPPNPPEPQTAPIAEVESYAAACKAAYLEFNAG